MTSILLIDDDPAMHDLLSFMLSRRGYRLISAHSLTEAETLAAQGTVVSTILLDRSLKNEDGLELLPRLARLYPLVPVVIATGSPSTDVVVEAMRRGSFDFLPKPVEEGRLLATVHKAVEHARLLQRVAVIDRTEPGHDAFVGIIGASPSMKAAFQMLRHVGPTDVSVLITGESGTGKELVARAVHRLSARSGGPFVPLNMAALPRELVEATLFGHEKGAYTGADRRREGAAGQAQGGTLFLDEISEMPLDLQGKLLRFLQERVYRPVGAAEDVAADVRIVSATNRDPLAEVQAGRLRADLYYRLAVIPVQLPPLRHRQGDASLIAIHALKQFAARYGKEFDSIAPSVLTRLESYHWPGNVRELVHLIERIVVLNNGRQLVDAMLPAEFELAPRPVPAAQPDAAPTNPAEPTSLAIGPDSLRDSLAGVSNGDAASGGDPSRSPSIRPPAQASRIDLGGNDEIVPLIELERRAIENALRVCNGSASAAALRLGLSTATIYRKIKEFGLATRQAI